LDSGGQPSGWKADGRRFEVATSAFPQYEGLRAAIALHRQWGSPEERYRQICHLSELLWQRLRQIDRINCLKQSPPEAGLVSFQVRGNISQKKLVDELEKRGFFLRTLANPDCIRACTHYFTLPSEIEQLAGAIEQLLLTPV
jgi:L-cysteine/cystine lyase